MEFNRYVFGCEHKIDDSDWIEYKARYDDLGRGELMKTNSGLYRRLKSKGLLSLIPRKNPSDVKHLKTLESGIYDKISRGKIKILDNAFYFWLRKRNILMVYPLRHEAQNPKTF
ncbi:hypothetical protein COU59_02295 [Candidatus Pacearchaeota archaeon CG10_big_fil_rev_8_21_14_0_10_34_12]|nr:MAG: hypothetical protein COU59_02295 [Candidatus Pacearchaeota archaeon CG10_big_fil_rev_8_21_14_0_10_34_12]